MKRFFAYATLLLLSLCLTVPALAAGPAITEGAAVTDLGGVLTAEELASLEDTAQRLADEYGCGVYALLLPDFTVYGYEDIFDFAQDVFEENALGLGDSQNGVLLAVSTETRDVSIAVHGDSGNTAFTDYGREEVLYDAFLSDFGNDDWYAGLEHYLDTCGYLLSEAANGTPVDVEPEEPVSFGAAFASFFAMALIPAAIIAFIACGIMKGHMKTARRAVNAGAYMTSATTLRTPIAPPPSSNHRPSGGYRGGTTVNSRGFSGSSRKF